MESSGAWEKLRSQISTLSKVGAHLSGMVLTPEPSSEFDLHA